jgi:hypothetical protein
VKFKIFRSLPQELEDEALREYDRQVDQCVFTSQQIFSGEIEGAQLDREKDRLFHFVFGYAQAKGWTDIKKRMNLK